MSWNSWGLISNSPFYLQHTVVWRICSKVIAFLVLYPWKLHDKLNRICILVGAKLLSFGGQTHKWPHQQQQHFVLSSVRFLFFFPLWPYFFYRESNCEFLFFRFLFKRLETLCFWHNPCAWQTCGDIHAYSFDKWFRRSIWTDCFKIYLIWADY